MIIRGGGAIGATGLAGAALCICATFAGGCAAGRALPACAAGVVTRGGTAIAGGAVLVLVTDGTAAGVVAAGGVTGTLGGITTTVGGRYPAATEAGVTILGVGGAGAGTSTAGLGGIAFADATGAAGVSAFASTAGIAAGGLTAGRTAGCSAAPFCCVMARSTSPGREIFERSILVLMPSSPWAAREDLAELGAASERPRRCFRTSSAS
jgi:hypothetical protein